MNKFFKSFLGLLTATASGLTMSAQDQAPRLVVGLHIDQLNANYLEWFKNGYGDNGFQELIKHGIQINHVVHATEKPDGATASANFATGSIPRAHGITGTSWYDPLTSKQISCILDPSFLGNYTASTYSPAKLQGSTLADELKEASNSEAKVYAIGIDPAQTMLLAGHQADGVFWGDDETEKWCTSTYYSPMPKWLENLNDQSTIQNQLGERTWTPLKALSYYENMPHKPNPTFFEYQFNQVETSKFKAFKKSPLMNAAILKMANELILRENLGKDNITDYLVLQLSAAPKLGETKSGMEIQDLYYRLDDALSTLLQAISQASDGQYCIYLTGSGATSDPISNEPKTKTNFGDFYPQRCTSLLNLYLMALYGNEQWVTNWDKQQVYLNRQKIEQNGLNPSEFRKKAAAFLSEFSGVSSVLTYDQLLLETTNDLTRPKANAIFPERAADLFVELLGGWNVKESADQNDYRVNNASFSVPFLFYRPGQTAEKVVAPVQMENLTASLATIFRIRPPNNCRGMSLPFLK